MTKTISYLAVLLVLSTSDTVHGQDVSGTKGLTDSLAAFTRKVRHAYDNAAYLGFRIKYRYANAGHPDQYIDSLAGQVEMDKGRSRVSIDGMETVQTDNYSINILSEDKIIYLAAAGHGATQNPIGILDSLFAHIRGISARLQNKGGADILTLDFPPGQPYTRIELSIDERSGFFRRVLYSVNTEGLVSRDMIQSPGHPAAYERNGQIEIGFSNYEQGHFDDRVFREENFFTRTAGRLAPSTNYKDYHIYLASSKL